MTRELPKTFDPAAIEARWYAHWESTGAFRPARPDAQPFTIVNPPPNVTGSLHIGHALDNTLQDIMIRYERLRGKDALWVVGTDHAGIATQMVVERQLEAAQDKRTNYSREDFIAKVWEWKHESGGTITRQLRRLGCSMDWSREQFTMDEHFTRAVVKVFVDLYNEGLIYRDKRLVNWDPKLRTAISDLEVDTQDVKGGFWRFRYPLADGTGHIEVATTRPETMLADMAVAVHPTDERYADLVARGAQVRLPLTGRLIPIVADEHADPELGSGAVKITPGHDFNDFEVGKRAGIAAGEMLNMLDADAAVCQTSDGLIPEELLGLDRFVARKRVVEMLREEFLVPFVDKDGEEHEFEPRVIATPFGDRGGVVIEPWLTDQWYVNAGELAKAPMAAVRSGAVEIVPKTWEKTFFNWMENIQPWCVSRQLWWGHRIPAWYTEDGQVLVAETEEEAYAQLRHSRESGNPVGSAELDSRVRGNDEKKLTRDPDVLDTWFSSALWPFATLGWPEQTPPPLREVADAKRLTEGERAGAAPAPSDPLRGPPPPAGEELLSPSLLAKHYPNNLLISGFDILFFWDARMMMMGQAMTGQNPWQRLYLHGLVRAPDGQKMSKSKGNVVDPLLLIDKFGADALRFFMAAMESQGRDIKMDEARVEGYRNFATKLWNATRFCQTNGIGASDTLAAPPATLAVNQWIIGEVVEAQAALDKALADLRFDAAANAIYHFAWDKFCDWYLELIKGQIDDETRAVAGWVLDQILVMLHPFMPFITEELWHAQGDRKYDLILAKWPEPLPTQTIEPPLLVNENIFYSPTVTIQPKDEVDWLIKLTTATRSARNELGISPGVKLPAFCPAPSPLAAQVIARSAAAIERLARLTPITIGQPPEGAAMQVSAGSDVFIVPLAGVIDIAAEQARLEKALAASEKEAKSLAGRLSNPAFAEKAKPEAVEKARADHAHHAGEAERLAAALARLG